MVPEILIVGDASLRRELLEAVRGLDDPAGWGVHVSPVEELAGALRVHARRSRPTGPTPLIRAAIGTGGRHPPITTSHSWGSSDH